MTDDALAGPLRVWQRKKGHRYSLDDTVTAWEAARSAPGARRCLDLGCGLGSVLLMLAYKLPHARLVGVEAQSLSFAMAEANVARNGMLPRVQLVHADLREASWRQPYAETPFELITGTPPYQPPGHGTPSPDPQRAHARVELRGGVEAYLEAAASLLAQQGRVVVCADARAPERVLERAAPLGLAVCRRRDVVPYADRKAPLFTVWTLKRAASSDGGIEVAPPFYARRGDGARSEEVLSLRRFFDLPVNDNEPPSPPRARP